MEIQSIGEIIRKMETDYNYGTTQRSKYVRFQIKDTLDRIEAYYNSKHISGETDALGRQKPFFNIVISAVNVWYRATDIDRSMIKVRATKSKDWIDSFLATIHIQEWMRRTFFGDFLNRWGRTLAIYGSAIVKFVEKEGVLHPTVVPFGRIIFDAIDFDNNPKIEILELTPDQLMERVETHGYDLEMVKELIASAQKARETTDKQRKDNKNNYIKLYEFHGNKPLYCLTEKEGDKDIYVQQMHVISFVATGKGRKVEYKDYTLYKGREKQDPYMMTSLIREEDRAIGVGAVEYLFEAQWMNNHSMKLIKDQLDLASKLAFQTSDPKLLGNNILTDLETGDVLVHAVNQPVTQLNNSSHDIVSQQNYAVTWKQLGNEITGISEAMLGALPKSGTAWRQTEALLNESYSLFELMTENKGNDLEKMFRLFIIPNIKKTALNNADEIVSTLSAHDINRIDARYMKTKVKSVVNKVIKDQLLAAVKGEGELPTPEDMKLLAAQTEQQVKDMLAEYGNTRFFKPSDIDTKTWKEQLKDLEWELEIDITGEAHNVQESMTTLNTALKLIMTPGFEQNNKAKAIVGKVLELTGAMSPVEYNAIPPEKAEALPPEAQAAALPDLAAAQ